MGKLLTALLVSITLSACGGGGDGGAVTPTLREGLYTGKSLEFFDLTGSPSTVLALDGGEVWALQGGYQIVFFGQGTFAYTSTEPGITTTTTKNTSPPTVVSTSSTPDFYIFSQSKALGAFRSNVLQEANMTVGYAETPYGNQLGAGTLTGTESDRAGGREATIEGALTTTSPPASKWLQGHGELGMVPVAM